jgi:cytosine/creatinine deaminase
MARLLLRNARTSEAGECEILCDDGMVVEIRPARMSDPATPDVETIDLDGRLVLTAAAEPHAHLDKAFLAERIENPTGDLIGAVLAMEANRHLLTVDDIAERAERAALMMLANGVTAVRTHADITVEHGLRSVEALLPLRDSLRDRMDIQVVGLCGWPVTGAEGEPQRRLLLEAIDMGIDIVGGCPHLDLRPHEANEVLLSMAAEAGLPMDLHTDETLNPSMLALEDLADRVIASGFPHPVSASHCVSLSVQPLDVQRRVAAKVAEAGISIITLPHTNLFLQGRDHPVAMPRAITPIAELVGAGVTVAAGADNLQDPFNPVGRADAFETAALLIMTSHLAPADAYAACSSQARRALGLDAAGPVVGMRADLVAVRAATVREAIAWGHGDRIVVRGGEIVARGPASHR